MTRRNIAGARRVEGTDAYRERYSTPRCDRWGFKKKRPVEG